MADLQRWKPSLQYPGRGPETSYGRAFFASARLMLRQNLLFGRNSVAVVIAVALVLVVGVVVATLWGIGDSNISPAGWIAMGFGVVVTLALGVGLMALVFISSRRGYDELGRGSKPALPGDSGE